MSGAQPFPPMWPPNPSMMMQGMRLPNKSSTLHDIHHMCRAAARPDANASTYAAVCHIAAVLMQPLTVTHDRMMPMPFDAARAFVVSSLSEHRPMPGQPPRPPFPQEMWNPGMGPPPMPGWDNAVLDCTMLTHQHPACLCRRKCLCNCRLTCQHRVVVCLLCLVVDDDHSCTCM